jgi:hypothetical protein
MQARTLHAHAEIIFSSGPGYCAGGRAGVERSQRGVWRGRKAGSADGSAEQSLRPQQRTTAGKAGIGAAAAGISILVRVGRDAPAGSAQDQAGTSILRGLQYLWWNERDQNWHLPFEQKLSDNSTLEDLPRYEFVTNIYQAFGLSLVAVLSWDVPRVRFFPSSAQAEEDVAAAKSATEVAQLVERNNRSGNLTVEEAFNLWTDGKVGAYVRFVVDGQRFGFHPETEIGAREVKIGSDVYLCPECGAEYTAKGGATDRSGVRPVGEAGGGDGDEAQQFSVDGADPNAEDGADTNIGRSWDTCGALLTEEDFVAVEMVTVPTAETRQRVPNGQEAVTIVGGLELKTPPWASEMHEYPNIQWNMEVHQARLRAANPHAADKIGSPVASGSQEYERLARVAQSQGRPLTEGGDTNINLITFQRTWLRPWALFGLDDKTLRDELLEMFPDGAYVALAGETYCESRSENMDDHWRVLHALPGEMARADGRLSGTR